MKKYFLHINNETIGPFDLEELKARSITKKTPVWFEGMEHWKIAEEIPELTRLFIAFPPPITAFSIPPTPPREEKIVEERKILGLSKNTFLIIAGILVLTTATLVFNNIQENRSRELKLKNHKTEVENYQYQLQQKEIEEQKIIVAQEEKAAAERLAKGKKEAANNRLLVIQQTLVDYQTKLEETEKKLINASGFKLLRTAADKKQQLDLLENNINFYKIEMDKLRNESDQLKLELEKI
jgi:hypothetical protein